MIKLRDSTSVELAISAILRWGIRASLLLLIAGTVMSFFAPGGYTAEEMRSLTGQTGSGFPVTLGWLLSGIARFDGAAVIVLGLAVLIATPVVRVAVAIVAFTVEKDRVYVAISCLVLILVCLSFLLGRAA